MRVARSVLVGVLNREAEPNAHGKRPNEANDVDKLVALRVLDVDCAGVLVDVRVSFRH